MVAGGHAWLPGVGGVWLGSMCGCWGHAWLLRGMRGEGDMHGKGGYVWPKGGAWQRGACMVKGGVHGI